MSADTRTTTDYHQFGTIEGNREVSKPHVRKIKRLIQANGNLNDKFPIKVNNRMEILDGQHRFEALKELGEPIVYEIIDGATINTVRAINLGNKNWSWQDLAQSYADLGNEEYEWFLNYVEEHGLAYSMAIEFCDQPRGKGQTSPFHQGYLLVENKPAANDLARHYNEIKMYAPQVVTRELGLALKLLSKSEDYDKQQMVRKMAELGSTLPVKATRLDFARQLEEIYNKGMHNRFRLF